MFDKLKTLDDLPTYTTDYQPTKKQQSREERLDKFNSSDYKKTMDNLPSYTTDYQPSKKQQTREQRLSKFNHGIYKNKGQQAEKVYNTEDKSPYKFVKKDILNSAFSEITITNEPFNKNYSMPQLYDIYENTEQESKEILNNIIFLNNVEKIIYKELIKRFTSENNSKNKTKLLSSVVIEYKFFNKVQNEYKERKRYFNAKSSEVLKSPTQIKEYVNNIVNKFFESIVDAHGGSAGYFYKIDNIKILLAKRKVTKAGTYIKLPDEIESKRACVNIKNKDDNLCIKYCLLAQKYHDTIKGKDKNETYHYKKHLNEIIEPKDIIYPIDIQHDIPKFEKLNNIKINVFQYNKTFTKLHTLYNTTERNENLINLLLIDELNKDGTKNEHLIWIKSINKLLRFDDNHEKRHWCTQCLNSSYKSKELLMEHQKLCYNHKSVKTKLPSKTKKDKDGNISEN